jgi:hypothetical protein
MVAHRRFFASGRRWLHGCGTIDAASGCLGHRDNGNEGHETTFGVTWPKRSLLKRHEAAKRRLLYSLLQLKPAEERHGQNATVSDSGLSVLALLACGGSVFASAVEIG